MSVDAAPSNGGVRLRGLLGDSALYGLGSIADKIVGFVLLPITASLLAPEDFGVLNLFGASATLLFIVAALGLHQALPVFHAKAEGPLARRQTFAAALWMGVAATTALAVFSAPLAGWFGARLFGPGGYDLFLLLFPFTLLQFVRQIGFSRLRLQKRPTTFVVINSLSTLAIRGVALVLLVAGFGVRGWIAGELAGFVVTLVLLWPKVLSDLRPNFDRTIVRAMLPFGLALTPTLFAHWLMVGADRYVMLAVLPNPREAIGLYAVGERIGTVIQMVNVAFVLGWQRFAFENMQQADGRGRVAHGLTVYAAVGGWTALALALLGDDLTYWLMPAAYNAGTAVIPAIALAGLLGGFAELVSVGLQHAGKAGRLSVIAMTAAVLQLALLFAAIPVYGIVGAAAVGLACQALKLISIAVAARRAASIPWEIGRLAQVAAVFGLAYFFGRTIQASSPMTTTLLQAAVTLAAPALLLATGFLRPDERARAVAWCRQFFAARRGGSAT
jgi:O-antigen/teichoic acid export membrane protein